MSQKILDILLPYQREWLKQASVHKRTLTMWSRQTGKSAVTSFEAVYRAVLDGQQTFLCISTGERASSEYLKKAVKWARYLEGMLRGTPFHFAFENTSTEIRFSNGSRIMCLPSNPEACRGYNANVIIDEFAAIQNAEELYTALMPSITSPFNGDKTIRIMSTPIGKGNLFWKMWTGNNDFYKSKLTIYDAVNQGLKVDIGELKKSCVDEATFAQEFLCDPLDADSALFPYEVLRNATYSTPPSKSTRVWLGVDIGRTHDKTSVAVLTEFNGVYYVNRVESLVNREFADQEKYISNLVVTLNPVRVFVDSSGIGAMLAENLHRRFPCVREIKFTNDAKVEMFNLTRSKLGDGTLLIPTDDALINDLHKIRRTVTPSGNVTYTADRDGTGHADDATAIALAVYATKKPATIFMPVSGG